MTLTIQEKMRLAELHRLYPLILSSKDAWKAAEKYEKQAIEASAMQQTDDVEIFRKNADNLMVLAVYLETFE